MQELKTDVYLTGCHLLLVDELTADQIALTRYIAENVYITGKKYRLMACIDDRAEVQWPASRTTSQNNASQASSVRLYSN